MFRAFFFWIACATFFSATLQCAPGGGDPTPLQNPTFTFTCNPPLRWTFVQNPTGLDTTVKAPFMVYPGQMSDRENAKAMMDMDIRGAIRNAIRRNGVVIQETPDMISISGFEPEDIYVLDAASPVKPKIGTYVPEGGAVVRKRTGDDDAGIDYEKTIAVNVRSPYALSKGTWQNLATEVYVALNTQAKVRFITQITIS